MVIENALAFTFVIALLLFSNVWAILYESLLRLVNNLWPNISFKERKPTHWLAQAASHYLGDAIDEKFSVEHAGHLLSRALVLFMQSPAILLYSSALGRQLS